MSGQRIYMKKIVFLLFLALFPAVSLAQEGRRCVKFETTAGEILIALYDETPLHRDNFLKLVQEKYYDGLLFHRVIEDFMVQAGDPDSRDAAPGKSLGEGGPDYTIPAEITLPQHYHVRGAVAAAREGDGVNPERRSSGSQFYIVWGQRFGSQGLAQIDRQLADMTDGKARITKEMAEQYKRIGGSPHLDGLYTVFGEVLAGLETVEAIQAAETDDNDRPLADIRIIRATVVGQ